MQVSDARRSSTEPAAGFGLYSRPVSPRISIALATFNGEPFLGQQLDSIAGQSLRPIELVVSDDGSSDQTVQILRRFAAASNLSLRLLPVEPARLGPADNFARAISACEGDLIALCDQDDLWRPDKLATLADAIAARGADLVFSDADLLGADGAALGRRLWTAVGLDRATAARLKTDPLGVLLRGNVVTGATCLFRAALRERALPIPRGWMHDAWLALVAAATGRLAGVDRPLIGYRQHGGQLVGAPGAGMVARLTSAARVSADMLGSLAFAFENAVHRLPDGRARAGVTEKARHLHARAAARRSVLGRVPRVAVEAITGRYGRYSLGMKSAAADLLLR